ncbi:adenosylcobinamide-phosphate synthase CbiB [Tissierella sp. Yu-01]|uniref:adenosylcobinamide-phosphate synthase CbiB n=1 Tax=Tissierella sp. Yu-01 TaxID=3035694 RepID=UPI00240DB2AD|nr:adenosylcobinamide-phosphate synthase CbiB [Tissierella sp. Yu-01]WFA10269.1 adenosylcobinamide-phosphate synthase CbiB [Tissierella sp. Yu-01]
MMFSLLLAVVLDFVIGDPYNFPHPVKLMGRLIIFEENQLRKLCKTNKQLKISGLIIVIINVILGFFIPFYLLYAVKANKVLFTIINTYLIYTSIAARCLHHEAIMVSKALDKGLDDGRKRLSYIVGRDTSQLSEEEVIKATVETVAENTSDGVIAPLFFIAVLGAPGGLMYKFVNTMDSMLGYRNEKYIDMGYFPARTDDLFNIIPARITGLLMNIGSIGKFDLKNGLKIMWRDRRNHKSPNSGYPESAVAGLLGIQLGGGNYYHGLFIDKPNIGDGLNQIGRRHIKETIEIMYRAEIAFIIFYFLINYLSK